MQSFQKTNGNHQKALLWMAGRAPLLSRRIWSVKSMQECKHVQNAFTNQKGASSFHLRVVRAWICTSWNANILKVTARAEILSIRIHIWNFTYPNNVLQVFLERCWPTSQCQLFRCWAWWSESEWPLDDQSALAREMFLAKHRISVKGNKVKQVHWPSHSLKVRCAYDQYVRIICPVCLGISWDAAAWSSGHGDGLPD